MQHCMMSLNATGLYEAPLPVWQFDPTIQKYEDIILFTMEPWHQFFEVMNHWSEHALKKSSENLDNQCYIFPEHIATAVRSVDIVQATGEKMGYFTSLPICGAHVFVFTLYAALDEALAAGDESRVLRLYEASLMPTVRMRLDPSAVQVILDQLSFSDTIRLQVSAQSTDSFFRICGFPSAAAWCD